MKKFKGKKILIIGVGKTGFKLLDFFSRFDCSIRVTDLRPIFDLNRQIKKLKKISPVPKMTFGEHRDEDFLEADVVVYSSAVDPSMEQLELARQKGKAVYSEFALANMFCKKDIIAVCGCYGRTTVVHMIGFALKMEGKKVFIGGTNDSAFIEYAILPDKEEIDYVVVEVSALQMRRLEGFHPKLVVFTNIAESFPEKYFTSVTDYVETKFSVLQHLTDKDRLVVNFDKLANNIYFKKLPCPIYWYSRKSFITQGMMNKIMGTHFHDRRIHSHINYHSEFVVSKMRIVGQDNRENLLAAITVLKILDVSDKTIQETIRKFPGISHRLEFVMEKSGVVFYNDAKAESMEKLVESIKLFKRPSILIAGGKEMENIVYDKYASDIVKHARILILVGECKERMNRVLGRYIQTFIVGSFEESVLLAYQKSRMGDVVLLSPGSPATDFFRDYVEKGNYYKKLIYQL